MFKNFFINFACGILSSFLQMLGIPALCEIAVGIGRAFGPEGCRHFSELTPMEQEALLKRAPILRTKHTDYDIKAFQWIPRTLTCYVMPNDEAPPIIWGTGDIEDIPPFGTYVATRGYMALTTSTGYHVRGGFRWDRIDHYLDFPSFAAKQR